MTNKRYPNIKEDKTNEWQTCSQDEINIFEDLYEEGKTEFVMQGIPNKLKEGYRDYYAWRITIEEGNDQLQGILKHDS